MNSKRSLLWLALALTAIFAMASSSPQCSRTTDVPLNPGLETLTGPDPIRACERDCTADARVATRAERKRHREALKVCNGDLGCQAEENTMHENILAEIANDLEGCLGACQHQQGAGTGGK